MNNIAQVGNGETMRRSSNARKYVTVISQDFFQKSQLSMDAMGLMGYLMSLPENWVVYVSNLRQQFNVGKDKMAKVINELIEAGYMKRYQERNEHGRLAAWVTMFSDEPEWINSPEAGFPEPVKPAPVLPEPANPPLINIHITNKPINNNNHNNKGYSVAKKDSVVVSLLERTSSWMISKKTFDELIDSKGVDYVAEKVELTEQLLASNKVKNPSGFFMRAIQEDWKKPIKIEKLAAESPAVYPTIDENKQWFKSLSHDQRLLIYNRALQRYPALEWQLEHANVNISSNEIVNSGWFITLMQLIGRAKD